MTSTTVRLSATGSPGATTASGVEQALVVGVMIAASGLFNPDLVPSLGPLRLNDLLVVAGAGVAWLQLTSTLLPQLGRFERPLVALLILVLGFAGFSIAWSAVPVQSLMRYTGLVLVSGWAFYAVLRFPFDDLLRWLMWTYVALAVLSAAVAVAAPSIGVMDAWMHRGDWNGIFSQKNTLGRAMALLVLVSAFRWLILRQGWTSAPALLVGLVVLAQTGSRTGYALAAIGLVFLGALLLRRRPLVLAALSFVVIAGLLAAVLRVLVVDLPLLQVAGETLNLGGLPISFAGRIGLWLFAADRLGEAPWLGYGYDGFWSSPAVVAELVRYEGWTASDAHNGYVDLVMQLGVVGLVAFGVVQATVTTVAIRRALRPDAATSIQFAAFWLSLFVVANITESYVLKATNVVQLLFTLSVAWLALRPPLRHPSMLTPRLSEPAAPSACNPYFRPRPPDPAPASPSA